MLISYGPLPIFVRLKAFFYRGLFPSAGDCRRMLTCRTTGLCVASSGAGSLPSTRPLYAASGKEGRRKYGHIAHGCTPVRSLCKCSVAAASNSDQHPDWTFTIKKCIFWTKKRFLLLPRALVNPLRPFGLPKWQIEMFTVPGTYTVGM